MLFRVTEEGGPSRDIVVAGREVTVGRSSECDIVLSQKTVSGRHLRVLDGLVVEDLGSRNGTFLDDCPIDGPELCLGRRLTIGGPTTRLDVIHDQGSPGALVAAELMRLHDRIQGLDHPAKRSPVVPAVPAVRPTEGSEASLLSEFVTHDAAAYPPRLTGPVSEFYLLESFRFMRNVETVVTRVAGTLTASAELHTLLPDDAEGQNVRAILGDLLVQGDSRELREDLIDHHAKILHWILVAYESYKEASVELVRELREALRPMALRRRGPIPAAVRALKLENLVLWRRAQQYLDGLSQNYILDRLDALARDRARAAGKEDGGAAR